MRKFVCCIYMTSTLSRAHTFTTNTNQIGPGVESWPWLILVRAVPEAKYPEPRAPPPPTHTHDIDRNAYQLLMTMARMRQMRLTQPHTHTHRQAPRRGKWCDCTYVTSHFSAPHLRSQVRSDQVRIRVLGARVSCLTKTEQWRPAPHTKVGFLPRARGLRYGQCMQHMEAQLRY